MTGIDGLTCREGEIIAVEMRTVQCAVRRHGRDRPARVDQSLRLHLFIVKRAGRSGQRFAANGQECALKGTEKLPGRKGHCG